MRTSEAVVNGELRHRSASPATDHAAVGLLVALGETFLEAGKLDHAESALRRAVMTIRAGAYASVRDTVMLRQRQAELVRRRRGEIVPAPPPPAVAQAEPEMPQDSHPLLCIASEELPGDRRFRGM